MLLVTSEAILATTSPGRFDICGVEQNGNYKTQLRNRFTELIAYEKPRPPDGLWKGSMEGIVWTAKSTLEKPHDVRNPGFHQKPCSVRR